MSTNIEVTDHALVRYMERVLKLDIEHYRNCVLSEIAGVETKHGVVYMEGLSWLFMKNKLISVIPGKISFHEFMQNT